MNIDKINKILVSMLCALLVMSLGWSLSFLCSIFGLTAIIGIGLFMTLTSVFYFTKFNY